MSGDPNLRVVGGLQTLTNTIQCLLNLVGTQHNPLPVPDGPNLRLLGGLQNINEAFQYLLNYGGTQQTQPVPDNPVPRPVPPPPVHGLPVHQPGHPGPVQPHPHPQPVHPGLPPQPVQVYVGPVPQPVRFQPTDPRPQGYGRMISEPASPQLRARMRDDADLSSGLSIRTDTCLRTLIPWWSLSVWGFTMPSLPTTAECLPSSCGGSYRGVRHCSSSRLPFPSTCPSHPTTQNQPWWFPQAGW